MNQEHALAMMKAGHNVFLTGQAGSGKTYCLNEYIRYLKAHQVAVAVTASTGIAATYLNGMTIHAWSGIGIKDSLSREQLRRISERRGMQKKMEEVKVLVIDEISMLHRRQFELVNQVLQFFKANDRPFGGIQVIFCGDFFQLPPVGKNNERPAEKFCFMSPVWLAAQLEICYLHEQHRQDEDELSQILNAVREQNITPACQRLLAQTLAKAEQLPDYFPHLYPHNMNVDRINDKQLAALPGECYQYDCIEKGDAKLAQGLSRNILAPAALSLKAGAKVMFVKNNLEQQIFNGTTGEVVGFATDRLPLVQLADGRIITVIEETWSIEDEQGKILASVEQLPLRLAWAVTVHKSQGMTLEQASMDLSRTFERGQGYVALSRLKSLAGLRLLGINARALEPEPLACKADIRFRALSAEAEQRYSQEALSDEWAAFIVNNGGSMDTDGYNARSQSEKLPTHLITKALWLRGHEVEDIMYIRGLSEGTIYRHLEKLKTDPEMDFERIPRDEVLIEKLSLLPDIQVQDEQSPRMLKPLYEALDRQYSYNEIRRALLFL